MSSRAYVVRFCTRCLAAAACALVLAGCGPSLYMTSVSQASDAVARARASNAAVLAPYELTYAELHLDKAREEAGHAAYQDAIRYAEVARVYGEKAASLSRDRARTASEPPRGGGG